MEGAKAAWPVGVEPSDLVEVWVRGYTAALAGEAESERYADLLAAQGFAAEGLLLRERLTDAQGNSGEAVTLLLRALDELRKTALPLCDATARAIKRAVALGQRHPERAGELLRALKSPFAVYAEDDERQLALLAIGKRAPNLCLEALGRFRESPFWTADVLRFRAACLEQGATPDAAAAAADLIDFLRHEPATFSATAAH
jgi:hypothetical protein